MVEDKRIEPYDQVDIGGSFGLVVSFSLPASTPSFQSGARLDKAEGVVDRAWLNRTSRPCDKWTD